MLLGNISVEQAEVLEQVRYGCPKPVLVPVGVLRLPFNAIQGALCLRGRPG
jgi:hypothetical protein